MDPEIKEHKIKIELDDYADKVKKIALTPITVLSDGVLIIAGTALFAGNLILEHPSLICKNCRSR